MPVDEEDLLIRSSSTLLHILQPQIGLGATRLSLEEDFESKHKRRHAERLDKLALLFVTRTQVAAIATTQKQDNVTVNVILDDSTAVDEITITKRHDEDVVISVQKIFQSGADAEVIGTLLRPVHDSETQARQLGSLISAYLATRADEDRARVKQLLRDYVYLQCVENIARRVQLPVDRRSKATFLSILDDVRLNDLAASPPAWDDVFRTIPEKVRLEDEAWLQAGLARMKLPTTCDVVTLEHGRKIQRLRWDRQSFCNVFLRLYVLCKSIDTQIKIVTKFASSDDRDLSALRGSLGKLGNHMGVLRHSIRHSPTVWQVLADPAIQKLYDDRKVRPPCHWLSGFLTHVSLLKQQHPDEATVGKRPKSDPEAMDDDLTEIGNDNQFDEPGGPETFTARSAFTHWLQCLCHWETALWDLTGGYYRKKLSDKRLAIKIVRGPPLPDSCKQATLGDTVKALNLHPETRDAWESLRRFATKNKDNMDEGRYAALVNGENDTTWENTFLGRVHCECFLACLMHDQIPGSSSYYGGDLTDCTKVIGVSKPCCFLCRKFLSLLKPGVAFNGSHGRVYPWAPPTTTDPAFKREILQMLTNQLKIILLSDRSDVPRQKDSGSGSEPSSSPSPPTLPDKDEEGFERIARRKLLTTVP